MRQFPLSLPRAATRRLWLVLCCAGLALNAGRGWAAEATVLIVSSEKSPAFEQAARVLATELERGGLAAGEVQQLALADLPAGSLAPKVVVALGSPAAAALARRELRGALLCALLPRNSFERIAQDSGRRASPQFSAIYLDQPLGRQLDLLRLALPEARRIGVLWGPESQAQALALAGAAATRNLQLVAATVSGSDNLYANLKRVLEDSDVLLALADPQVYNSSSIQNILLASYRARVPMLAFSPAYVRAGALAAVYVTPEQVAVQAAGLARQVLQGRGLPAAPVHSRDFSVGVNEHVARSMGLSLDARALEEKLRAAERPP